MGFLNSVGHSTQKMMAHAWAGLPGAPAVVAISIAMAGIGIGWAIKDADGVVEDAASQIPVLPSLEHAKAGAVWCKASVTGPTNRRVHADQILIEGRARAPEKVTWWGAMRPVGDSRWWPSAPLSISPETGHWSLLAAIGEPGHHFGMTFELAIFAVAPATDRRLSSWLSAARWDRPLSQFPRTVPTCDVTTIRIRKERSEQTPPRGREEVHVH